MSVIVVHVLFAKEEKLCKSFDKLLNICEIKLILAHFR